ncbi:MAG: hypothetical protein GXO23_06475 [Crenarchaeota archaeon]|nr:hypothetical protein [Thermoproteota archaeon]
MLSEIISVIIICMIIIVAMSVSCNTIAQMLTSVHVLREVYGIDAYVWNIHYKLCGVSINELIIQNRGLMPFVVTLIYNGDTFKKMNIVVYRGQRVKIPVKSKDVLVEICSLDYEVCKYVPATENRLDVPAPERIP